MKKSRWYILFTLTLLIAIVLIGCNDVVTTTNAPAKPIELKLASWNPPVAQQIKDLQTWADKVQEKTGDRVKITIYPAETLGKQMDEWQMLKSNISQIGFIASMFYPADFPLCQFGDLPFLTPEGRPLPLLNKLFEDYLSEEYADAKVLWPFWAGVLQIHTADKKVESLSALKGMQIRCPPGKVAADTIVALGATPVSVPSPEAYAAFERKMVDGALSAFNLMLQFKWYEVLKCNMTTQISSASGAIVMNLDTWNSLPSDIQKIFDDLSPYGQELMNDGFNTEDNNAKLAMEKAGNTIYSLSAEEKAKWEAATKPVIDAWTKEMDAKGLPGTDLVEAVYKLR